MSRWLFIATGILTVAAFACGVSDVWFSDPRWLDTAELCGSAGSLTFVFAVFLAFWES